MPQNGLDQIRIKRRAEKQQSAIMVGKNEKSKTIQTAAHNHK